MVWRTLRDVEMEVRRAINGLAGTRYHQPALYGHAEFMILGDQPSPGEDYFLWGFVDLDAIAFRLGRDSRTPVAVYVRRLGGYAGPPSLPTLEETVSGALAGIAPADPLPSTFPLRPKDEVETEVRQAVAGLAGMEVHQPWEGNSHGRYVIEDTVVGGESYIAVDVTLGDLMVTESAWGWGDVVVRARFLSEEAGPPSLPTLGEAVSGVLAGIAPAGNHTLAGWLAKL